ncbi:MAG: cytochrome c oxidase accessory protein CcoG [Rhodospirillaceae bacterium]|nr:cytochrome c oxidase accessory protein CcoG [Rhodospirillaceae bacterium]
MVAPPDDAPLNPAPEDIKSVREQKRAIAEAQASGSPLYASRIKVHPKAVSGTFRTLKWRVLGLLLAVYYILPWIRWDRGPNAPDQAVLVDMTNRRGYFFFIEIWPQEVFYLTGILILAAVGLFLVTSLAGRVWCGYACPQTVWTDLFMWVERQIEGDRNARIKLDKAPWTGAKWARKIAKHAAWLVIAFATGGAWITYFVDAPTVVGDFFTGKADSYTYFFVGLFTATTYLLAGWAREQVCTYMCPWPRFQSAMFDEDTLIVTYQKSRGEPRGKASKDPAATANLGDCVDCGQCVAVCPMGIDIRDGVQLECIGCALCIDACNPVMAKLGRPANLIGYDTERRIEARAKGQPLRYRILRPRTILYAMLFAGVGIAMLAALLTRSDADINVLHDRNPLYVTLSDGAIRNGYTIKILNKERAERIFRLEFKGLEGARFRVVGLVETASWVELPAEPDTVTTYQIYVSIDSAKVNKERSDVRFLLTDIATLATVARHTWFYGPKR